VARRLVAGRGVAARQARGVEVQVEFADADLEPML
jgi:hypothetical protein